MTPINTEMGGPSKVKRAPLPEPTAAEVAFMQWQGVIGRLEQCEAGAEKLAALCRSLLGGAPPAVVCSPFASS